MYNAVNVINLVISPMFPAPSKAPPPPPPPPPGEEKKDDPPAGGEEEEEDKWIEFEFELLGHPVKLPKLPKPPPMPDWLRAIIEYRFPSSIDPFTGRFHQ